MAAVPEGVGAPVQYGPRVRAIGAYLVGYQHLPYERARETLSDLFGVGMSVGTLTTVMARTSEGLSEFLDAVRQQLEDFGRRSRHDSVKFQAASPDCWMSWFRAVS